MFDNVAIFDNVAMFDNVDNADNVTRMSQEVKTRAPELSKLGEIKPLIVCPRAVPFTETAFVCRQNLIFRDRLQKHLHSSAASASIKDWTGRGTS